MSMEEIELGEAEKKGTSRLLGVKLRPVIPEGFEMTSAPSKICICKTCGRPIYFFDVKSKDRGKAKWVANAEDGTPHKCPGRSAGGHAESEDDVGLSAIRACVKHLSSLIDDYAQKQKGGA